MTRARDKEKFRVPNRNLTHDLLHCVIYNYCLFAFLSRTTSSYGGFSYYFTFCSSISLLLLGNAWHNLPWYTYCVLMASISLLLPVLVVVTSLVALFSGKCYYMSLCWYIKLLYFYSEVIGQCMTQSPLVLFTEGLMNLINHIWNIWSCVPWDCALWDCVPRRWALFTLTCTSIGTGYRGTTRMFLNFGYSIGIG